MRDSNAPVIRVLHVPLNTPYAQKIKLPGISIANGTRNVPELATIEWVAGNLSEFDICHVHFFELTPAQTLSDCLIRCKENLKHIVVTLHDIIPIHGCDPEAYAEKIRILMKETDAVVTLTIGAAKEIQRHSGRPVSVVTLPLGCVVEPMHRHWGMGARCQRPVRFAAFGSLRQNRRIELLVQAFDELPADTDATLSLLVRPIGTTTDFDLERVRGYESPRVSVRIAPAITDEEVIAFVAESSVLVLPYDRVCHSGQLELAFDMGVSVVAPIAGYLREQWQLNARFVRQPTWFVWTARQGVAERVAVLARALRDAYEDVQLMRPASRQEREAYREHRQRELTTFLDTHRRIYSSLASIPPC
jgi:hypothetical protein